MNIINLHSKNLDKEREEAVKHENYEEAEFTRTKIDQLKTIQKSNTRKELNGKHRAEFENLETQYRRDYHDLEENFNSKFLELENKSHQLEDQLNIRHAKEMEELYNYLDMKLPKNVKYSSEYIRLKNQEHKLASQQKYKEAIIIRNKAEKIEKEDTIKFNKDKTEKIKAQSLKTANKHLNEKNAFRKKIEIEYEVLKKEKEIAIETYVIIKLGLS